MNFGFHFEFMIKISAVIITYNEEENIGRCIDSLQDLADEIIILDSYSTDNTKKICEERNVKFFQGSFEGHIQQKNSAVSRTTYDFILSLDADEYLSPELRKSILKAKSSGTHQAYSMNRVTSLKGRWIYVTDWYPDKKIRLWNKNYGQWGGYNPHDKVILAKGTKVKNLSGNILHVAYDGTEALFKKAYTYAVIYAKDRQNKVRSSTLKIAYKTIFTFFRNYVLKLGFTYGYDGLVISFSIAAYTFFKYSMLKEFNSNSAKANKL